MCLLCPNYTTVYEKRRTENLFLFLFSHIIRIEEISSRSDGENSFTGKLNIKLNALSTWNVELSLLCADGIMFWERRTVHGCLVAIFNTCGQLWQELCPLSWTTVTSGKMLQSRTVFLTLPFSHPWSLNVYRTIFVTHDKGVEVSSIILGPIPIWSLCAFSVLSLL